MKNLKAILMDYNSHNCPLDADVQILSTICTEYIEELTKFRQ